MRRASLVAFGCALLAFVALDALLHQAAIAWGRREHTVLSLVAGELLLPFAPVVAAGLLAGYLGTPRGFWIALGAGAVGGALSTLWRLSGVALTEPAHAPVWWSVACWWLGSSVATGVCGWAGERLHAGRRS